eukprot:TRINITY_DN96073_c0_g1_i1.p1 TRINITY_DN96073_c0_g1~~TRINITY_DN96073_c0_g1_i1.p1  ORF type:complete len:303 (+),score=39.03 TRINITY_DN96073_c0_g1_i1:26-934(+)
MAEEEFCDDITAPDAKLLNSVNPFLSDTGTVSGAPVPPPQSAPSGARVPERNVSVSASTPLGFLTIAFWRDLFDVDTEDVVERVMCALKPMSIPPYMRARRYHALASVEPTELEDPSFPMPAASQRADLYGPLWVCTTLWVVVAVVAHLTRVVNCPADQELPECHESWAAAAGRSWGVIFGFEFFVPVCLWGFLRIQGAAVDLLDLICLYGYAFSSFILASVVCAVPWFIVQWAAVVCAFCVSTTHIVSNLWAVWRQNLEARCFFTVLAASVTAQLALAISLKWNYFTSFVTVVQQSSAPSL